MRVIQWIVIIVLFVFWLAEDEQVYIEESIGELMPEAISHEKLSETSFAVVYADGGVTINDESMGIIALSAGEAYALLDVLYRHEHILRQRADTVPLELPEWAQPDEQWQASGTCQVDAAHVGRDVFRCDGCGQMACNECGELVEDLWLCESCLLPREPIMQYPF